jgi:hypothetical protein
MKREGWAAGAQEEQERKRNDAAPEKLKETQERDEVWMRPRLLHTRFQAAREFFSRSLASACHARTHTHPHTPPTPSREARHTPPYPPRPEGPRVVGRTRSLRTLTRALRNGVGRARERRPGRRDSSVACKGAAPRHHHHRHPHHPTVRPERALGLPGLPRLPGGRHRQRAGGQRRPGRHGHGRRQVPVLPGAAFSGRQDGDRHQPAHLADAGPGGRPAETGRGRRVPGHRADRPERDGARVGGRVRARLHHAGTGGRGAGAAAGAGGVGADVPGGRGRGALRVGVG